MTLEEELFEHTIVDKEKLLSYGFIKQKETYLYKKLIHNDEFQAIIVVTKEGAVTGTIIELAFMEEIVNFRLNHIEGTFMNGLKEEYIDILQDIKKNCFLFQKQKKYWVIPANYKQYDVIGHFQKQNTILWKQTIKVEKEDIVYIYIGAPISAIILKCEVVDTDIMIEEKIHIKLKKIEQYPNDKYPFKLLKQNDLKAIRGARKVPERTILLLEKDNF